MKILFLYIIVYKQFRVNSRTFLRSFLKSFKKVTRLFAKDIVKPGQVFVITIQTGVGILSTKCAIILL